MEMTRAYRLVPYGDGVRSDGSPMIVNGYDVYLPSGERVCAVWTGFVFEDSAGQLVIDEKVLPLVRAMYAEIVGGKP